MVEAERGFNLKGGTQPSESESDAVDLSAKKEQRGAAVVSGAFKLYKSATTFHSFKARTLYILCLKSHEN